MIERFSSYSNKKEPTNEGTSTLLTGNHSVGDEFVILGDIEKIHANSIFSLHEL